MTDAFVGKPVHFEGMLVDSEPYGAYSSQLFFNVMRFGIDGGYRVLAPRRTRMTARRINFARNLGYRYIAGGASVTWQTAFYKEDGLQIDAHDSEGLAALATTLEQDDVLGLIVRWNAYRSIYFDDPNMTDPTVATAAYDDLRAKLNVGGWQPNPSRSELVGVLGLWRRGEPAAVGGDRFLASLNSSPIASAYARLEADRITVDLQNSIPETGLDLTKENYGDLQIIATDPDGNQPDLDLATIPYAQYDREAYNRLGGDRQPPGRCHESGGSSQLESRLAG